MNLKVQVVGIRELQRALRATSDAMPKAIQNAHKSVAEIVVRAAKGNAAGTSMVDRIRAVGTTRDAKIRFLGHRQKPRSSRFIGPRLNRIPHKGNTDAFLQEFGGRAPLFGLRDHWHEVKARNRRGYIVYPAIRQTRDQVMERYAEALDEALQRHFAE